jgi:flagella basal body P-ring formation protein FlgA
MVELPVLTRSRNPGDVIQRADLATIWLRSEQTPSNALTDLHDVVGKTPNRPLRANQPLRPLDVELPVVIKRNDLVLIVLEEPGLYLTAEGKALDEGGIGSVIRVTNVQSSRTIDTVVLGSGRVAVRTVGLQQAAF